jgi:hypothetical protein
MPGLAWWLNAPDELTGTAERCQTQRPAPREHSQLETASMLASGATES